MGAPDLRGARPGTDHPSGTRFPILNFSKYSTTFPQIGFDRFRSDNNDMRAFYGRDENPTEPVHNTIARHRNRHRRPPAGVRKNVSVNHRTESEKIVLIQ